MWGFPISQEKFLTLLRLFRFMMLSGRSLIAGRSNLPSFICSPYRRGIPNRQKVYQYSLAPWISVTFYTLRPVSGFRLYGHVSVHSGVALILGRLSGLCAYLKSLSIPILPYSLAHPSLVLVVQSSIHVRILMSSSILGGVRVSEGAFRIGALSGERYRAFHQDGHICGLN